MQHLKVLTQQSQNALLCNDTATQWQRNRAILKYGGRRPKRGQPNQSLPHYTDKHGNTLTTRTEIADTAQAHF
jgi:hypothetical protein